jgi:hypothetical protein
MVARGAGAAAVQIPMSKTTFGCRILDIIVTSVRNSLSASSLMLWSDRILTATEVARHCIVQTWRRLAQNCQEVPHGPVHMDTCSGGASDL